jgi:hypothetical protein
MPAKPPAVIPPIGNGPHTPAPQHPGIGQVPP